jgi:AcrR family transcriptional regulator
VSTSRAGRRSGSPDTRSEILTAARRLFGRRGYDRTTIRAIATEAAVDPALIHHYFGSKEDLFAFSIALPLLPAEVQSVFAGDRSQVGRRLSQLFFAVWEQEAARASLLGILRSAMGGEEQAVAAFRQFLTGELVRRIVPLIDGDDSALRALLMASHLVGVAMTRYVVRLEPIATVPVDDIIDLVAPRVQSYLE